MAHIHEVKDAETHFIINATSREISNVDELPALVQHDHNSEVFTFVVPRYVDGHDMATCNKTRVHYINIDSATKERHADVYEVKDLKVDETDETKVVCTWTISRYATQYAGVLNFVLQYACENDGVIDYSWNTAIFTGITVKNGINNAEQVVKDYSDVLEAWKKELEELAASGGSVQSDWNQNDETQPNYIKNRIAYYGRKFEDIEVVHSSEPIFGYLRFEEEGEVYEDPLFLKVAESFDNFNSIEVTNEIVGMAIDGEEMRIDDPTMFPEENLSTVKKTSYYTDDGQLIGSGIFFGGEPYVWVIDNDNASFDWLYSYTENDETYEETFPLFFPEKGIYLINMGAEDDENGNIIYYTFEKILFNDAKRIDKNLLPFEALNPIIEVDSSPEWGSQKPISSDAVMNLKYQLETGKMDNIYISTSDNGNYLVVKDGKIQAVPYWETAISSDISLINSRIANLESRITAIESRLNIQVGETDV